MLGVERGAHRLTEPMMDQPNQDRNVELVHELLTRGPEIDADDVFVGETEDGIVAVVGDDIAPSIESDDMELKDKVLTNIE